MSLGSTVENVWRAAWDALVRLNHLVTETGNFPVRPLQFDKICQIRMHGPYLKV